jgi:hypothetical protein
VTVTPQPVPGVVPPPKKSGCLKWGIIGCLAVIVLGAIGIAAIVVIVFGAIKSSDVYKGARATAQKDPRVIQALGSPVEPGWWIKGNVSVRDHSGEADIDFPISGPKGSGRVHAVATRENSGWRYSELVVTPENGPPIDLLKP